MLTKLVDNSQNQYKDNLTFLNGVLVFYTLFIDIDKINLFESLDCKRHIRK